MMNTWFCLLEDSDDDAKNILQQSSRNRLTKVLILSPLFSDSEQLLFHQVT